MASFVIGTYGFFNLSFGGLSSSLLQYPSGCAVDQRGGLYVADRFNHRVLFFPNGSDVATFVYGQADFDSSVPGCSASALNNPTGVALDRSERFLLVADTWNHRVVNVSVAVNVLGQNDLTSCNQYRGGSGNTNSTMNQPVDVTVDKRNGVYVVDWNRVLYFLAESRRQRGEKPVLFMGSQI